MRLAEQTEEQREPYVIATELSIRLPADLGWLHLAARLSRLMCDAIHDPELQEGFADSVELAVSEACTNAIRHSRDVPVGGTVGVVFCIESDRLMVQVKDCGSGFEMDEVPEPDFQSHPESGYGLYIIRSVMDGVSYRKGVPYNTLTMVKYFRKMEEQS